MAESGEKERYDSLAVAEEALARGGVELLRIAGNEDKLFLTTRPALKDPAEWGEILAELTGRLGVLFDMGGTGYSEQDVVLAIGEACPADMGAQSPRLGTKHTLPKRKPASPKQAPRNSQQKS